MSCAIQAVRIKIIEIAHHITTIFDTISFRFAAVAYRDYVQAQTKAVCFDFTSDIDELRRWVDSVELQNGGDGPEDWVDGMNTLLGLSWARESLRSVCWIADSPAHGRRWCGYENHQEEEGKLEPLIRRLQISGVVFLGLDLQAGAGDTFEEMQRVWAENANGQFSYESIMLSSPDKVQELAQWVQFLSIFLAHTTIVGTTWSRPQTLPPSLNSLNAQEIPQSLVALVSDYVIHDLIGHGAFANVYSASRISDSLEVAVKYMDLSAPESQLSCEREIMALQSLNHPGCLVFVAFERKDPEAALVTMLMKGTLHNGIERERAKSPLPDWATTKSICVIGIAFVMEYLHLSNWLHRDLKPENVLLNNEFEPVLADFGLAKQMGAKDGDFPHMTFNVGTPFHMAPELFMDSPGVYGPEADVYSFAILLYRLFTPSIELDDGKGPWKSSASLRMRVGQNARYVKVDMPPLYWQLIQSCWKMNPSDRPTFSDIIDAITSDVQNYLFPGADKQKIESYIDRMQEHRPMHHTKVHCTIGCH
jgi:hypothetical protein